MSGSTLIETPMLISMSSHFFLPLNPSIDTPRYLISALVHLDETGTRTRWDLSLRSCHVEVA